MKLPRILVSSCFALAIGCDTTPDDPLGHYSYVEPVRDLMPMFAAWDTSLPDTPNVARRRIDAGDTTLYAARPR